MPKGKFYVVWKGLNPGIYDAWDACRQQVEGQEDAKYKAFPSRQEAVEALAKGHQAYLRKATKPKADNKLSNATPTGSPILNTLAVDAACSGNPGDMEYRGVLTATKQEIFHVGPLKKGTNNVGEFLALVHGLALLKQQNSNLPIYSDSVNAIKWVKNKKCKTLLERSAVNEPIFDLIERAERWLKDNTYTTRILKWETAQWGEIPADFGRK
jgi:ribonuclease HI